MAKQRNSRFIPLKEVLDDMIKEMRIGGKMDEMKVRKYWHELMGTYIANQTSKIFYKQGKLFVYIPSSVLKQELFMAREKIKSNLNERLQEQLIQEIIFR
ncbi:MAG: DUF721 domain-containing protein [Chitinophagales bacterium]